MAEAAYITRTLLKERLNARQIPLPNNGDSDLDRLINVASGMTRDRCNSFDETAPPAAVQQVTLVLCLRMRVNETMLGSDADGKPVQVPLWTQDLDDILGSLLRTDQPEAVIHAPVQGSIDVPAGHKRAVRIQAHRGRPAGYWGYIRDTELCGE